MLLLLWLQMFELYIHYCNNQNPYVIIDKGAVERMEKGKTGISMLVLCYSLLFILQDIRNFFLWMFTMEVTTPKWIFVGNKPNIQNVTFLIEKKENTSTFLIIVLVQKIMIFFKSLIINIILFLSESLLFLHYGISTCYMVFNNIKESILK